MQIIYFSNVSNNTHRFVEKLDFPAQRIPLQGMINDLPTSPYILITPTYGNVTGVPHQVRKFLNLPEAKKYLKGVIASGNTNFGADYAKAGYSIEAKCRVPLLYTFELLGTDHDIERVTEGITNYAHRLQYTN